jgi:hypothetical protein
LQALQREMHDVHDQVDHTVLASTADDEAWIDVMGAETLIEWACGLLQLTDGGRALTPDETAEFKKYAASARAAIDALKPIALPSKKGPFHGVQPLTDPQAVGSRQVNSPPPGSRSAA